MTDNVFFGILLLAAVIAGMLWLCLKVAEAIYTSGVTDGYGYAKEPNCPGYKIAGRYLRKHMAHRWPELED